MPVYFYSIFRPKMTPWNTANLVFEPRNPSVKCISAFSSQPRIFLPLGCQHAPMLAPKIHEKPEKVGARGCLKNNQFSRSFVCASGALLGAKLAPRTAQDGAHERPRAARDAARGGPETLWKHKAHPRHIGPPKMTPRTLQNEPSLGFRVHLCRCSTHF